MAVYSHSRLQTFQNCPLQYKLRYIDRVKSERHGIEAFMGSMVHEAMEKLYRDLRVSKLNELEDLLGFYRQSWDSAWHDGIFIVKKDYTARNYRDTGERCIRDYYERCYPFEDGRTLWLEEWVRIPLDSGGKYSMTGVVDRLVDRGGGAYEIHDYKTSASLPTQKQADSDRQLALYQLAAMEAFPDAREMKLVWHYLAFDKDIVSERSEEDLRELKRSTIALIEVVEGAREFEPRESALCAWCDYPHLCPLRRHLFAVQDLAPREFSEEDGVRLADRYVELRGRKRELEAELEGLQEEIAEYCGAKDYATLRGTEHMLTVKRETRPAFPKSGSQERSELEELLRKLGRWDGAAALNAAKLTKTLRERSWPEKELRELERFATWEESVSIRPRKLKDQER